MANEPQLLIPATSGFETVNNAVI